MVEFMKDNEAGQASQLISAGDPKKYNKYKITDRKGRQR
jgi:hypothetical protein